MMVDSPDDDPLGQWLAIAFKTAFKASCRRIWWFEVALWKWKITKAIIDLVILGVFVNLLTGYFQQPEDGLKAAVAVWNWMGQNIVLLLAVLFLQTIIFFVGSSQSPVPSLHASYANNVFINLYRHSSKYISRHMRTFIAIGVIVSSVIGIVSGLAPASISTNKPLTTVSSGIFTTSIGGELLGLSNGRDAFDLDRLDGGLKKEAINNARAGKMDIAKFYWDGAANEDTTDAEALIQQENLCIQGVQIPHDPSDTCIKKPYQTVIVATTLSGDAKAIYTGRDILQGAYVAQKEHNELHPDGPQMYLLIANIGSPAVQTQAQRQVAAQIIQEKQSDNTFLGVTGLPSESETLISALQQQDIAMISTAPLTYEQPPRYLLSVSPDFDDYARAAVTYINNNLPHQKVAVVSAQDDPYSHGLAMAFQSAFNQAVPYYYTRNRAYTNDPDYQPSYELQSTIINTIIHGNYDLVYMTGPFDDVYTLQRAFQGTKIQIICGDTLYQWVHAPPDEKESFYHLYFTAPVYPDEWSIEGSSNKSFPFYNEEKEQDYKGEAPIISDFPRVFDHYGKSTTMGYKAYLYDRPDGVSLLSYDALALLAQAGCTNLANCDDQHRFSIKDIWAKLTGGAENMPFQGITGQISFKPDGHTPVGKAVAVLGIEPGGMQLCMVTGHYRAMGPDKQPEGQKLCGGHS